MQLLLRVAILVCVLGAPASGAVPAPPLKYSSLNVADGCFVDSVAFYDAWLERQGASAWCRVLQWGAKEDEEIVAGHAVAIFEHQGKLWAWDVNTGFSPLTVAVSEKEQVEAVAAPVTAPYPSITARHPTYRHDFPQTITAEPPAEVSYSETTALRDASRVAARLGRYRPVKLVEFSYPSGGSTVQSAACVFVFHGRLCVYVPGHGTVPFRARALSVENLRQTQELLRRIHPGSVVRTGGV